MPAVVLLHGDAGALSNQPVWIDKLIATGIAVFTVDSFTGRAAIAQQPSIMIVGRLPTPLMRVPDAQRALDLLARLQRMPVQRNPALPNVSRCELVERGGGLVNAATGEPLRPTDACVSTDIEGGPMPAVAAQTHARVRTFFKTLFAR